MPNRLDTKILTSTISWVAPQGLLCDAILLTGCRESVKRPPQQHSDRTVLLMDNPSAHAINRRHPSRKRTGQDFKLQASPVTTEQNDHSGLHFYFSYKDSRLRQQVYFSMRSAGFFPCWISKPFCDWWRQPIASHILNICILIPT